MDLFTFLALSFVAAGFTLTAYLIQKNDRETIDKLLEKFNEKPMVTLPWDESIEHPENQLKDDDHVPLEEMDDNDLKANVGHMFTTVDKDEEAEEAKKEVI